MKIKQAQKQLAADEKKPQEELEKEKKVQEELDAKAAA
jgi:hypothetical protein